MLIFIDWYVPAYKAGGPIKSIINLIDQLKNEFDIWIITSNEDLGESLELDQKTLNTWLQKDGFHIAYLDKKHRNIRTIKSLIKSNNFNSVYINSLFSLNFSILPLFIFYFKKTQTVLAPRGMLGQGALSIKPFKKKLFLWVFKTLKIQKNILWHATDKSEETEIKSHFGATSKVLVVPNLSAQSPVFSARKKEVGVLNLFFVSRIAIKKKLLLALDVLKEVSSSQKINFTIIGPVDEIDHWEQCQSMILQMPSHITVKYLGAIPNHKLNEILKDQHVLFLPTQHENFGHVIVEAWQCSCPVVISDNSPWRNLEEKKIGFDISLENLNEFILAIEFFSKQNEQDFKHWSTESYNYGKAVSESPDLILNTMNLFTNKTF